MPPLTLQAGEARLINLKHLQRERIPGVNGEIFPETATFGGLRLTEDPRGRHFLIDAVVFNAKTATCGVCGYGCLYAQSIVTSPRTLVVSEGGPAGTFIVNARMCDGSIQNNWACIAEFTQTNPTITDFSSGCITSEVTGLSAGTSTINVFALDVPNRFCGEQNLVTSIAVSVQGCNISIAEETISPNSLPVWNPATIRRMFAPVFEALPAPASCPVTWSITGPGSIVGATNDKLLTVNGNSLGNILMRAMTTGGRFAEMTVPVVNQREIELRVWIVRRSDGTMPATTVTRVNQHIADINKIWEQCGVQFRLVGAISYINSTGLLTPNAADRELLRGFGFRTGGMELYYVDSFPDDVNLHGENSSIGAVIGDAGNSRTVAHELGHAMGLGHSGIADLRLMHTEPSDFKADITLGECTALSTFQHN